MIHVFLQFVTVSKGFQSKQAKLIVSSFSYMSHSSSGPKNAIGVAGIEPGSAAGTVSESRCHVQVH